MSMFVRAYLRASTSEQDAQRDSFSEDNYTKGQKWGALAIRTHNLELIEQFLYVSPQFPCW